MDAGASRLGLLGLVVCGGMSRRMGSDKALLDLAGVRLVERAIAALDGVVDQVVLATGREARYGETGLECVLDEVADAGPLAGLVAGLEFARQRGATGLVVTACDTPRASGAVYRALSNSWQDCSGDALLLQTSEGQEPLIAIYGPRCAAAAKRALDAGRRRMTAFHSEIKISYLDAADVPVSRPAINLNTPEELEAERQYLGDLS